MALHPNLRHLRKVKIGSKVTSFWRNQELGKEYLSTLEAIYWAAREFHAVLHLQQESNSLAGVQREPSREDGETSLVQSVQQHSAGPALSSSPRNASKKIADGSFASSVSTPADFDSNPSFRERKGTVDHRWSRSLYRGEFDDLMLIYAYMHQRIRKRYEGLYVPLYVVLCVSESTCASVFSC